MTKKSVPINPEVAMKTIQYRCVQELQVASTIFRKHSQFSHIKRKGYLF